MFNDYVYIMTDVCGITKRDKKEEELADLTELIKTFKTDGVSIFGTY